MNRREFLGRIGLTAGGLIVLQSGCAIRPEAKSSAITAADDGFLGQPGRKILFRRRLIAARGFIGFGWMST